MDCTINKGIFMMVECRCLPTFCSVSLIREIISFLQRLRQCMQHCKLVKLYECCNEADKRLPVCEFDEKSLGSELLGG